MPSCYLTKPPRPTQPLWLGEISTDDEEMASSVQQQALLRRLTRTVGMSSCRLSPFVQAMGGLKLRCAAYC